MQLANGLCVGTLMHQSTNNAECCFPALTVTLVAVPPEIQKAGNVTLPILTRQS
jgi:hypothetical protein